MRAVACKHGPAIAHSKAYPMLLGNTERIALFKRGIQVHNVISLSTVLQGDRLILK